MPARPVRFSRWIQYGLVLLGLGAIMAALHFLQVHAGTQAGAPVTVRNVALSRVQSIFPSAAFLRPVAGQSDLGEVRDHYQQALGKIILTSPQSDLILGYRGPTPLLIGLNSENRVAGVCLLPNAESENFIRQIEGSGLLRTWDGLAWENVQSQQVETITGATVSSRAIARTLQHRLVTLTSASLATRFQATPADILTLAYVIIALFFFWFRFKYSHQVRIALLVLAVIYLGFFRGLFLSMALFTGWMQYGLPWPAGWVLLSLAGLAVAVPILTGKPFYCNTLCPFGAAQELVSRVSPWRWVLSRGWYKGLRWSRQVFLGLIAVLLLLNITVDLTLFEPFTVFLFRSAGVWVLSLATLSLLLSLFVSRFWCIALCPTGTLLDLFRRPRR